MKRTPLVLARHLQLALCLLLVALWTGPALCASNGASADTTVQVQDGDMASVLAFRLKPRGATIEQMMVALLKHNPDAFIQGNVNLLRDGAVLHLPPAEEVFRTPADEARDTVQRHHKAFLSDLESAATPAPRAPTVPADTATKAAAAPPPDPSTEREALLERLRTAKAHLGELQQNIQELERLTRETEQDTQEPTAPPAEVKLSSAVPMSWIWLAVAAIIAVMIGVGAAGRPKRKTAKTNTSQADAAQAFQASLGSLDLNLDAPSTPPALPGRPQ